MTTKEGMNKYRTTASVVGLIYIAGMVIGIGGNILVQSILGAPDGLAAVAANSTWVAIGALLWLMAAVMDVANGILMYPILRPRNERVAVGYLAFRIVDAVFIAVMIIFILLQIPLASEYVKAVAPNNVYLQALSTIFAQVSLYAYHIGMFAVGAASLMLCYTLYRAKLVPRFLAVWGLIGYAVILGGSVLELLGFDLMVIHTIPGGLWELFIGGWLIAKGFSSSAFVSQATRSSTLAETLVLSPEPANS